VLQGSLEDDGMMDNVEFWVPGRLLVSAVKNEPRSKTLLNADHSTFNVNVDHVWPTLDYCM